MIRIAKTALAFAARSSFASAPEAVCVSSSGAGSCKAVIDNPSAVKASSEQLLIQKSFDQHALEAADPGMVNDESGFDGVDEGDLILDTNCKAGDVRRRRRGEGADAGGDMCSCRRRSSGMRYDGGWLCQNDRMVQEESNWTRPVWSDEFNRGSSVDSTKWSVTDSGSGNGNNELQWYTTRSDNIFVDDGVLKIVGKREEYGGKPFTSAKITSKDMGDWGPGVRIEIRAKLPLGVGTWPALWMMPTDSDFGGWPKSGEIDIMEAVGRSHGKVFGTIHTDAYNHMRGTHKGKSFYTDYSEWHTYALHWEEDKLLWFADGNLYNTFAPDDVESWSKWPFSRRFYLILNLAIGGNLGGSVKFYDDQVMEIDYVRVYCLDGSKECTTPKFSCCSKCSGKPFCSPSSHSCYDEKAKDYYESCTD